MKRFAVLLCLLLAASRCQAQYQGSFSQQTVTQSFSVAAGTPTPHTVFTVQNLGQAAHSLIVFYGITAANCTVWLQGSTDGLNWTTIVSVPDINALNLVSAQPQIGYANGHFPLLRINVNPKGLASCTVDVKGDYVGYQNPIPNQNATYNNSVTSLSTPISLTTDIEKLNPSILEGFSCFNPGAAIAYLQISDWDPSPAALGTGILYDIGIPAGGSASSSVPFFSGNGLSAGAATAAGGTTAVSTGIECDFQINVNGPFGPVNGMPTEIK